MANFTKGKWKYLDLLEMICAQYDEETSYTIAYLERDWDRREERAPNGRLIAAAPEMYELLCAFIKVHDKKLSAADEKNEPAYMMAVLEQVRAINLSRELLARVDGKEEDNNG